MRISFIASGLTFLIPLTWHSPSPYLKDKIKEYESKIERLEKLQKSKMAEFDFDKALENLEKVLKLDATEANKILKMFVDELIISENNGIIDLRIKTTAPLSTVVGIKEMGCPMANQVFIVWIKCELVKKRYFVGIDMII